MPKIAWLLIVLTLMLGCLSPDAGDRSGGSGGPPSGSGAIDTGLPCDVQAALAARCTSCHGVQPLAGVPMSLVTYADLTRASLAMPAQSNAERAVARMQDPARPMPPPPASPATASEIAALSAWIAAGYPQGSCVAGGDGGAGPDPFAVPPTCTSNRRWTGGTEGSPSMSPGQACIACHATSGGEAPRFALAGTVYPTAHEPNDCNGASGSGGAQVVITGADGRAVTLTPNGAGNFYYQGTVALPYLAKVLYMGRERVMVDKQTSGDCNACHTQDGTMSAPGRILLP
jgi:cytochrome c553